MRFAPLLMPACILAMAAAAARGEQSAMLYDVRLMGLRAGVIEIAANVTATAYAARSTFRTAGIVGLLKRLHAEVTVQGTVAGDRLRPHDYAEAIDNGLRVTDVRVRFAPGRPRLISGATGSSAPPADTSRLRDPLDPMTVLYLTLRDQPREAVCRLRADVFDGHRHAVLRLDRPQPQGDGILCNGTYRRVAGYGDDERDQREVAIAVTYLPGGAAGEVMRATRVAVDTRLGPAVMERR